MMWEGADVSDSHGAELMVLSDWSISDHLFSNVLLRDGHSPFVSEREISETVALSSSMILLPIHDFNATL